MQESFLHFLWRWRRFDANALQCSNGSPLEILHPGEYNTDAGPDFFNARIRIDDTLWAGNVEMHVKASEWLTHRHQEDPAYDNVVLHVVYEEDRPVMHRNGTPIPCLVLKPRIPQQLFHSWQQLEQAQTWIPCQQFFPNVPEIIRLNWFDRLLVERLEQKTEAVATLLESCDNHWEQAFYIALARNFGLKVNVEPFEALARSLPLLTLTRHRNQLFQLEALVFGQAGMLARTFAEEYPQKLAREYKHLRNKYGLVPLPESQWKFLRLRPANFPTVRLAQFAALAHRSAHLFDSMLEAQQLRELEHLFDVQAGDYWMTHYQFDKTSTFREKHTGRDFVHLLVINTIAPFLFYYGKSRSMPKYQEKALHWLEQLPAESNALINGWAELGLKPRHAYQTQALLQLKTRYCDARKCLSCAIGTALMK